jgi:sulfate transport system permease protein
MARALGEFGAVAIVGGGLIKTMTQYVQASYENGDDTSAYAASVLLAALAILTLILMTVLGKREDSLGDRSA